MGNSVSSHPENNIFEPQLRKLNTVIRSIINEKDLFINKDYDFLSQDVCSKYNIILEEELQKHLKVQLKNLGQSLYLIPKDSTSKVSKKEICDMISNHYMKILYILCLVKYVYNLEQNGDRSIAGIVFNNIKITSDIFQLQFCSVPHKDYSREDAKINFAELKGMEFFTKYFLNVQESHAFVAVLRSILGRKKKGQMRNTVCKFLKDSQEIKALYEKKYKERLVCAKELYAEGAKMSSLNLFIEKDNPVFSVNFCRVPDVIKFKTNTKEGQEIIKLYKEMKKNYENNVSDVYKLLFMIITSDKNTYSLKDISKEELDKVIRSIKSKIQMFYMQSIVDYQNMIDAVKNLPSHLLIL